MPNNTTTTKPEEQFRVKAGFINPYTTVQNYVYDCMSFEKPIDKLTYINLLRFAFNEDRTAYPSIKKLAMMASVSENTVRDAIKRLVKMGLVDVEERHKDNGEWLSNLYTVYDLPPTMVANSVSNKEVFDAAIEANRRRKKEKHQKKLSTKSTGTSNSEGGNLGTSNSEVLQILKEGTSNSEDEKEDLKKDLKEEDLIIGSLREIISEIVGENSAVIDLLINKLLEKGYAVSVCKEDVLYAYRTLIQDSAKKKIVDSVTYFANGIAKAVESRQLTGIYEPIKRKDTNFTSIHTYNWLEG